MALSLLKQPFYATVLNAGFEKNKSLFEDRKRRINNKVQVVKTFGIKTGDRLFPDKAKMQRLAIVKKQHKKPMGR